MCTREPAGAEFAAPPAPCTAQRVQWRPRLAACCPARVVSASNWPFLCFLPLQTLPLFLIKQFLSRFGRLELSAEPRQRDELLQLKNALPQTSLPAFVSRFAARQRMPNVVSFCRGKRHTYQRRTVIVPVFVSDHLLMFASGQKKIPPRITRRNFLLHRSGGAAQ